MNEDEHLEAAYEDRTHIEDLENEELNNDFPDDFHDDEPDDEPDVDERQEMEDFEQADEYFNHWAPQDDLFE